MDREEELLYQAAELIRAGRHQEAVPRLLAFVKTHPQSEQAWFLLSYALPDPHQRLDSIQRAVKINPANAEARARLNKLASAPPPRPAGPSQPSSKISPFTSLDEKEPSASGPFLQEAPPAGPARAGHPISPAPPPSADAPPLPDWLTKLASENPASSPEAGAPVLPEAPLAKAAEPASPPAQPAAQLKDGPQAAKPAGPIGLLVGLLLVISILVCLVAAYFAYRAYRGQSAAPPVTVQAALPSSQPLGLPTLPPTATPTPVPSREAQASPTALPSSPAASRTPTQLPTPNATDRATMDTIQSQVADLRGLAIQGEAPRHVISKYRLEAVSRSLLLGPAYPAALKTLTRVYSALGLIQPGYDLTKYLLDSQIDIFGGFYIPGTKDVVVVGDAGKLGALERFAFSHEYDHALTDQHFHFGLDGIYPDCQGDAQRCEAIRALVEGDALLLMNQWMQQYAGPADQREISSSISTLPKQALPEPSPSAFTLRAGEFPYDFGFDFVKYLYTKGKWPEVDRAYVNLPQSTEQILHPEKFLAGEAPVAVSAPPLTNTLGADWYLVDKNSLGEWMTYLILGYGADPAAQVDDKTAAEAAKGWGGDAYQIYANAAFSQTVLAAQWQWDTTADAKEFRSAMQLYLNAHYRGAKMAGRAAGDCWQTGGQTTCLFGKNKGTLWLAAPEPDALNAVLKQYPDFP